MAKRGRPSRAELALSDVPVVDVGRRMPPPPPAELTDAQAQVWRDAVSSMPANWLTRGSYPILIEYCRHVCRARLLEAEVAHFDREWIAAPGGIERLDRLLAMAEREGRAALQCARALRLTPQSRMEPKTAGRAVARCRRTRRRGPARRSRELRREEFFSTRPENVDI